MESSEIQQQQSSIDLQQLRSLIQAELRTLKENQTAIDESIQQQPSTPPESTVTPVYYNPGMTVKYVNGNPVIFTSGRNGDDFGIHRMPSAMNTGSKLHQTIGDDPVAVIGLGIAVLLGVGVFTWIVISAFGSNRGNDYVQQRPYQPQPYSITTKECKPSGFLWLGETCNTTTERGVK
jgi:hypothetical protein